MAAALLVTRTNKRANLPSEFLRQLFARPEALAVAGGFLGVLSLTSLPKAPLVLIAGSCIALALRLSHRTARQRAASQARQKAEKAGKPEERIEDYLAVDPMEVEIGVGLIKLADPKRGGDLLERIHRIRQNVASEIGIILPKLRIRDSFQLDQQQYRIKIAGLPVASGTVHPGMFLAMDSGMTSGTVPGLATNDPAFGTPALWIEPPVRQQAEMLGYTVVEPCAVIATHLTETVRRHAAEILTRDATKHLIDELRQTAPAVVDELIPAQMKLAEVQQILQSLLREQVPIRRLSAILETLGDYAGRTKDRVVLAEYVRARLARTISTRYRDRDNRLHVVTLDPALEDRIRAGVEHSERGLLLRMSVSLGIRGESLRVGDPAVAAGMSIAVVVLMLRRLRRLEARQRRLALLLALAGEGAPEALEAARGRGRFGNRRQPQQRPPLRLRLIEDAAEVFLRLFYLPPLARRLMSLPVLAARRQRRPPPPQRHILDEKVAEPLAVRTANADVPDRRIALHRPHREITRHERLPALWTHNLLDHRLAAGRLRLLHLVVRFALLHHKFLATPPLPRPRSDTASGNDSRHDTAGCRWEPTPPTAASPDPPRRRTRRSARPLGRAGFAPPRSPAAAPPGRVAACRNPNPSQRS